MFTANTESHIIIILIMLLLAISSDEHIINTEACRACCLNRK